MKKTGPRGFTFLEIIITMAIIATLAAIIIPTYANYRERAKIEKAIAEIITIAIDITTFENNRDALPGSLADVGQGNLLDPWGNSYQYLDYANPGTGKPRKDRFLKPLNSDYDLFSIGKDGDFKENINNPFSFDDIIRANDGTYVGLASEY